MLTPGGNKGNKPRLRGFLVLVPQVSDRIQAGFVSLLRYLLA